MSVAVDAYATVTVWGVSISKSFSTRIEATYTLGSNTTTPWVLAAGASGGSARPGPTAPGATPLARASRSRETHRRLPIDVARVTRLLTLQRIGTAAWHGVSHPLAAEAQMGAGLDEDPCGGAYRLDFSPDAKVFADGAIEAVDVRVLPALTVADMPVR